jgi:hypothetical protein
VRAGVFSTAALSLCLLFSFVFVGHAQSLPPPGGASPLPGFVPPYEIANIVREAGYDPLTRPRREGATYVVRATNHRGILMRVVVDARSGAIRAVNRIVPGPASYGAMGMMPPPYGEPYDVPIGPLPGPPPPYAAAPYGPMSGPPPYPPSYDAPPGYGVPPEMMGPPGGPMEADLNGPPPPSHVHPWSLGKPPSPPPSPRPRPPGMATHEAKPPHGIDERPSDAPMIRSEPPPNAATIAPGSPGSAPSSPALAPALPPPPPPAAASGRRPPSSPSIED